jgi:hypothetical protein
MTKTRISNLLFLSVFSGEMVNILADLDGRGTIPIDGCVIDSDTKYIYLGDSRDEISRAIPHDAVRFIEIYNKDKAVKDYLKDLPAPPPEGIN